MPKSCNATTVTWTWPTSPTNSASRSTTCCHWSTPLELLAFARLDGTEVALTDSGLAFSAADVQESKKIFAAAALDVPLVKLIATSLENSVDGGLHYGFFRDLLAHHYTSEQVTAKLEVATDWGCYAELYSYDANHTAY